MGYSCSQSLGPYLVLAEVTWVAQRLRTALPKIPNWAGVSLWLSLKIGANSMSVFVTKDNKHNAWSKWSQMWYTKIRILQNCKWLFFLIYVSLTVHLDIIFVNNQLDARFFFMYVYFYSLHVSDSCVSIIRKINCINTTSGICHSVHMTVWYAGFIQTCIPNGHLHRMT